MVMILKGLNSKEHVLVYETLASSLVEMIFYRTNNFPMIFLKYFFSGLNGVWRGNDVMHSGDPMEKKKKKKQE